MSIYISQPCATTPEVAYSVHQQLFTSRCIPPPPAIARAPHVQACIKPCLVRLLAYRAMSSSSHQPYVDIYPFQRIPLGLVIGLQQMYSGLVYDILQNSKGVVPSKPDPGSPDYERLLGKYQRESKKAMDRFDPIVRRAFPKLSEFLQIDDGKFIGVSICGQSRQ
jgi:hypothetical protein